MKSITEMVDIMLAYEKGEQVQWRLCGKDEWHDCKDPIWNWSDFDFRKKPSMPRYVPFDTMYEFLKAQMYHGSRIKTDEETYLDSCVDYRQTVCLINPDSHRWFTLEKLFENCKFSDDSPCGKLVEE